MKEFFNLRFSHYFSRNLYDSKHTKLKLVTIGLKSLRYVGLRYVMVSHIKMKLAESLQLFMKHLNGPKFKCNKSAVFKF